MSGTRPSSPGFGRHWSSLDGGSAMQRQPEPSDGKPKVPDAGNRRYTSQLHQSKRGKTRFRDDRSRKYYFSGTNCGRYNVKKYEVPNSKIDLFSLRKESPVKQYSNKKDKVKQNIKRNEHTKESIKIIQKELSDVKDVENVTFDSGRINNDETAIPSPNNALEVYNKSAGILPGIDIFTHDEHLVKEKSSNESQSCISSDSEMKAINDDKVRSINGLSLGNSEGISSSLDSQSTCENVQFSDKYNYVEELYSTLKEYLQVESKFQPRLYLPVDPQRGEIAAGTRDGAVHVLRCLKVWYDLPTDVLFHAINLLDRFLTKMKVRLCHISCISVSCMHIAIVSYSPQLPPINTEELVSISQCKCTAGDVRRMSTIIEQKLGVVGETVSPLHWLRLLLKLLHWASTNLLRIPPHVFNIIFPEAKMINQLEILSCDASCCNIRACELALALLCTELDSQLTTIQKSTSTVHHIDPNFIIRFVDFAMELQKICQIADDSFYTSHQAVVRVLERYNTRQKTPHRQCLVWRLSSRTLKILRPTDKLTSTLPTILEQYSPNTSSQNFNSRMRSGSESSEDMNEDMKDWPTSPVVPILCNNN